MRTERIGAVLEQVVEKFDKDSVTYASPCGFCCPTDYLLKTELYVGWDRGSSPLKTGSRTR